MRVSAAVFGACAALAAVPARAQETVSLSWSPFWKVFFLSTEIEKSTAFLTVGTKTGVTNATKDVSFFVATSYGFSLSDNQRARRYGWDSARIEQQSRAFVGVEHSFSQVFVSLGVGLARAEMRASRQPDKAQALAGLAAAAGLEPRLLPQLIASLEPRVWRGLQPPRMQQSYGGVVDLTIWWRPTAEAYASLAVVGDTAAQSLWSRLRLGYRFDPLPFAIGPEVSAATGRNWEKLKLGVHIGEVKLWRLGIEAAAGWMSDETRRSGTYGSLSMHVRF